MTRHDFRLQPPAHRRHRGRALLRIVGLLFAAVSLAAIVPACSSADPDNVTAGGDTPQYRTGRASRDGIGKFYMGREISHVMGHRGAAWLERPEREREERTDLIIRNLPLKDDDVVADIGAGTGYFSFPVARRVPNGRVLAVDIQQEMLDIIAARTAEGAGDNVFPVMGSEQDPNLPAASVDLILIVDAYHEFSHPYEMGVAISQALKPGGLLVLIEYRAEDPRVPIKPLHKMTEEQARREMRAVGLEWVRTEDFLPQQHFMVFRRPSGVGGVAGT